MIQRTYNITQLIDSDTKKRYFASDLLPWLEPMPTDRYIITDSTDRLDLIAERYYGNVDYWVILALSNEGVGEGSLAVPGGLQLRIPGNIERFDQIIDELNNI